LNLSKKLDEEKEIIELVIEHMFDYYLPMVDLHLIDGSCENCIRLFAALEETMRETGPIAILFTPDGSIVLYMEERFLLKNETPERNITPGRNLPSPIDKEARRRSKKTSKNRIKVPNSNFEIIYKKRASKKKNPPSRAENQRTSHQPNTYKFSMSGRAHTYLRFLKKH